ncbi:MAG TPA: DUF4012 domain-containing protein [Nocardioides sp.]
MIVLAGVWAGWQAWQVRADLMAAQSDAQSLKASLLAGDQQAAEGQLKDLQQHSENASERTDSATWSVLEVLPVFGDDAKGVQVVSSVLDDLARDGLPALVKSGTDLDAGSFAPRNGKIDIESVKAITEPVSASEGAFAEADARLRAVDSDGFVGAFKTAYDDLSGQIRSASRSMDAAARVADILPSMLGESEKRTYMLVFQNNAELRSTGGLPGAGAIVTADDGDIEMTRQFVATDLPYKEGDSPLPVTLEERAIFDTKVGDYFQDANFTPDFPRTSELMAAHWKRKFDQKVDGVISIDPIALAYLLGGTGPVTVDGVTLTKANAVDELLNKTYLKRSGAEQNEFFEKVAKQIFEKFSAGEGDPRKILEALARATDERRLLVTSFDEAEQAKLAGTKAAGEMSAGDGDGQIGVYLNDATMSKMSYYLDYDVKVRATGCADGVQKYSGTFTLKADTPPNIAKLADSVTGVGIDDAKKGDTAVVAHIYSPVDGDFDKVFMDGQVLPDRFNEHEGHVVSSVALIFEPGERHEVTFRMTGSPGHQGATDVVVTPGTKMQNESSRVASACD